MTKPLLSFAHTHYVPALKLKTGEVNALKWLGNASGFTPLLEVLPLGVENDEDDSVSTSLEDHLQKQWRRLAELEESFGGTPMFDEPPHPLWIDTTSLSGETLPDGTLPLARLGQLWGGRSLCLVPVVLYNDPLPKMQAAAQLHERDRNGVCLRLSRDNLASSAWVTDVPMILNELSCSPGEVDLVLDLQEVMSNEVALTGSMLPARLNSFPFINDWRSLSLLGGSFPTNISGVQDQDFFERHEWALWNMVMASPALSRRPAFGDYAISHPEFQVASSGRAPSPSLRYTLATRWIAYRGTQKDSWTKCADFCRDLMQQGLFAGATTSHGDQNIGECAAGQGRFAQGPGNATTWREIGCNHHIATVLQQLNGLAAGGGAAPTSPSGGGPVPANPPAP